MAGAPKSRVKRVMPMAAAALVCLLMWQIAASLSPVSLAPRGARSPAPATDFPAFTQAPDLLGVFPSGGVQADDAGDSIDAGTMGRLLRAPESRTGSSFAILGDRAFGTTEGKKYLDQAVDELNMLRPDLVFSIGNQIEGYTRCVDLYASDVRAYGESISRLTMPWYPCAGSHDVFSGTRDPGDHRFEMLYQKYFGPLYYSLNYRDLHFIVLYSAEQLQADPRISETQLTWLSNDLNKAFENRQIAHVFVLLHKPLWQYPNSGWDKVHSLLADFNRRPVVAIEDPTTAQPPARARAPRVEAVFAGERHAFTQDPPRDGIAYYVLGVTGGVIDQDKLTGEMQSYLMVKVDGEGTHLALVEPGSIHPRDFVTARDRAIVEQIQKLDEKTLGIEGLLDQPAGKSVGTQDQNTPGLRLVLNNPLDVPLDVAIRMASTRLLYTQTDRDAANQFADNYDSPWRLYVPYQTKHLQPHSRLSYAMGLFCPAQGGEVPPPQVEFVVSFLDSQGRTVPVVLKRRVPLIPSVTVPVLAGALAEKSWDDAPHADTYAFIPSRTDPVAPAPDFNMLADAGSLYFKVHVESRRFSYFANFSEPDTLPCDAIAIAFAPSAATANALVQRIVIFPFAPKKPLLLTNNGVGKDQTALLPLDISANKVTTRIIKSDDSYDAVIGVPRPLIFAAGTDAAVMNVEVTSNDDSSLSTRRSWAREELGPKAWGRVQLERPEK